MFMGETLSLLYYSLCATLGNVCRMNAEDIVTAQVQLPLIAQKQQNKYLFHINKLIRCKVGENVS